MVWLKTVKNPAPKIQRWRARLNEYHYDAKHIKGTLNKLADTLSRAFPFEIVKNGQGISTLINTNNQLNQIGTYIEKCLGTYINVIDVEDIDIGRCPDGNSVEIMDEMTVVDFPKAAAIHEPPNESSDQTKSRNVQLFKRQQDAQKSRRFLID